MSKFGLFIAKRFGKALKSFDSQSEAEEYFFWLRDKSLQSLEKAAKRSTRFKADYSVESLKDLDEWYSELSRSDSFGMIGMSRREFEESLEVYLGQVAHYQAGFDWIVQQFVFVPGKYEIGLTKGLATIMVRIGQDSIGLGRHTEGAFTRYHKYYSWVPH